MLLLADDCLVLLASVTATEFCLVDAVLEPLVPVDDGTLVIWASLFEREFESAVCFIFVAAVA